ncbi:MAG: AAA-like domain-containing protein [Xenococcaceae cyanobacterium]
MNTKIDTQKLIGTYNDLSLKRRQVLIKILEGKNNSQIATEMEIKEGTVRKHSSVLYETFDFENSRELSARFSELFAQYPQLREQLLSDRPLAVRTSAVTNNGGQPHQAVAETKSLEGEDIYVARPEIEEPCYRAILQPGCLIRMKGPRGFGKTWLMNRTLKHAKEKGYRTVALSFELADKDIFQSLDSFLYWFCANVTLELGLDEKKLDGYWQPKIFGSKTCCKSYFEKYLLAKINSPLVLGLDDFDLVFQYPEIAEEFLALLRAWLEEAKRRDIWQKLRLILVHFREIYIPLNIHQSPFNVGLAIELPEFSSEEIINLAQSYELQWNKDDVEKLMKMVGGHPHLVSKTLKHISSKKGTLAQILETAPTEQGIYAEHLNFLWYYLQQDPKLKQEFAKVVAANNPVQISKPQLFQLYGVGLISKQDDNYVTPRCNLYRQYFLPLLKT